MLGNYSCLKKKKKPIQLWLNSEVTDVAKVQTFNGKIKLVKRKKGGGDDFDLYITSNSLHVWR